MSSTAPACEEPSFAGLPPRRAAGRVAACLLVMGLAMAGCGTPMLSGQAADRLLSPEGRTAWQSDDSALKAAVQKAGRLYQQAGSLDALRAYDQAVRSFLDHGFLLLHAYQVDNLEAPAGLISSLDARLGLFMDVADEYIKQGSTTLGVGIASQVVKDYSDLPMMSPAQRRAEAILLRYRYRQDY